MHSQSSRTCILQQELEDCFLMLRVGSPHHRLLGKEKEDICACMRVCVYVCCPGWLQRLESHVPGGVSFHSAFSLPATRMPPDESPAEWASEGRLPEPVGVLHLHAASWLSLSLLLLSFSCNNRGLE